MTDRLTRPALLLALVGALLFAGCDAVGSEESSSEATEDAAASIAASLSEGTGGLLDQASDVLSLAAEPTGANQESLLAQKYSQGLECSATTSRSYEDGVWTLSLSRTCDKEEGVFHASFDRLYQFQYLDAEGNPQPRYLYRGERARTILFTIIEGSGSSQTARRTTRLDEISGEWTVENAHQDTVTVSGGYGRAGENELRRSDAVRTLDHELDLTVTDLVGPRGSRRDLSQKVSGAIEGSFHADVTFERGDAYREGTIDRQFSVVIEDGVLNITVNEERFRADAATGDLSE